MRQFSTERSKGPASLSLLGSLGTGKSRSQKRWPIVWRTWEDLFPGEEFQEVASQKPLLLQARSEASERSQAPTYTERIIVKEKKEKRVNFKNLLLVPLRIKISSLIHKLL